MFCAKIDMCDRYDRTIFIRHTNIGESFYGNAQLSSTKQISETMPWQEKATIDSETHVWTTVKMIDCTVDVIPLKCSCKHYHRYAFLLFYTSRSYYIEPFHLWSSLIPWSSDYSHFDLTLNSFSPFFACSRQFCRATQTIFCFKSSLRRRRPFDTLAKNMREKTTPRTGSGIP